MLMKAEIFLYFLLLRILSFLKIVVLHEGEQNEILVVRRFTS